MEREITVGGMGSHCRWKGKSLLVEREVTVNGKGSYC